MTIRALDISTPAVVGSHTALKDNSGLDHEPTVSGNGVARLKNDDSVDISPLAEPLTFAFSGRTAPNRFLKAPMTERLASWNSEGEDVSARGVPSPEYANLYSVWGRGRIGILVTGNIMVDYGAVEGYGNAVLRDNHDGRLDRWREVTRAARAEGSLVIAQLSHPGRQGGEALNPHPVSASDVQLKVKLGGNSFARPRALTVPEIGDICHSFAESAKWCKEAGFDGVQIHCAHGYLLAQFLSPSTNKRTDEYGGSMLNRARIVRDVVAAVRAAVPDPSFIVAAKINSVEFQAHGTTAQDFRELCVMLEELRVDFVDLSGGTFEHRALMHQSDSTVAREAYFLEFAEAVRPHLTKTKVFVTGGFRTAAGMANAVASGACDGVGMGRPLVAEPFFCRHLLEGKVKAALRNLIPLPQNNAAAGTQMRQLGGESEVVSDWSSEDEVRRWIEAFNAMTARMEAVLPKVDSSGFPDLEVKHGYDYHKM